VGLDTEFAEFGLDSATLVRMAAEIGERVGVSIPATSAWNHPTIRELARSLAHGDVVESTGDRPGVDPGPSLGELADDELADLLRSEIAASRRGRSR